MDRPDATTLHMTPRDVWEQQRGQSSYVPEGFEREGFVHCTDGAANLIDVGNRYYVADPRSFVAITLDVAKLTAPVRYEDPQRVYPHVFGPIDVAAVTEVRNLLRAADGRFLGIEPPPPE